MINRFLRQKQPNKTRVADTCPDLYGNTFSGDTKGNINLTAAKASDPDGGECECKWLLADSVLAEGCKASVLLDTGRYVIVLRVTDDEQLWAADTLNAVISRCVIPPAIDTSYDFLTTPGCMSDYDHLAGDPLIYLYGSLSEIVFRPYSSSSAS